MNDTIPVAENSQQDAELALTRSAFVGKIQPDAPDCSGRSLLNVSQVNAPRAFGTNQTLPRRSYVQNQSTSFFRGALKTACSNLIKFRDITFLLGYTLREQDQWRSQWT